MIVTTAGRTNLQMTQYANQIAKDLEIPFIIRNKKSIIDIQKLHNDDVVVVGKNRLEIYPVNQSSPLFFHPNSAMFRIKRVLKGSEDPLVDISELQKGKRFLDCTLGLGSDSIVASLVVGSTGKVIGLEGNKYLAYIIKEGLTAWGSGDTEIDCAMKNIEVIHSDYLDYLKTCPDNAFDIVYFDPMFEEEIDSDGIKGLKQLALRTTLSLSVIEEAIRVANEKVIMKDHWKSNRFQELGFTVLKRKSAKFHFGVIEIQKRNSTLV